MWNQEQNCGGMILYLKYFFISLQVLLWNWVKKKGKEICNFCRYTVPVDFFFQIVTSLIDQIFMIIFSYFKSIIKWVYSHVWKTFFQISGKSKWKSQLLQIIKLLWTVFQTNNIWSIHIRLKLKKQSVLIFKLNRQTNKLSKDIYFNFCE